MKHLFKRAAINIIIIFTLCIGFCLSTIGNTGSVYAEEPPTFAWFHQFGTSNDDGASGICIDSTGIYIAGSTTGSLPDQSNLGNWDTFLRKYDTNGNELWTRQFGTTGYDYAWSVCTDTTGIYVLGTTTDSFPGYTNAGWADVFIRKYDTSGNVLWTRQFGTNGDEWARSICADSTGIYVAGSTRGSFPGQSQIGGIDAFVIKYDASGNEIWVRQFGTPAVDFSHCIAADPTGIYVSGYTRATLPGQTSAGRYDAFIRKYDTSGNELWTHQFGTAIDDFGYGLTTDSTGVYLAGYAGSSLPGQSSSGNNDAFIRKYDTNGNELWTRQYGTSENDFGYWVSVNSTGIYLTGVTFGNFPGQSNLGNGDCFIRKYDASINDLWTIQFGSAALDYIYDIASAGDTGVYIVGATAGSLPGQTPLGGNDAFVAKIAGANSPPDLDPIGDKTVKEGETLSFSISATDPDVGDTLSYSASNLPPGATFNETTHTFSWTPDYTQAGTYNNVYFEVFDGNLTDSELIIITVIDVTPQEAIDDFITYIDEILDLPQGTENSLISKLEAVIKSLDNEQENAAVNKLEAFINEVEAQRGNNLTDAEADELIQIIQTIIDNINN